MRRPEFIARLSGCPTGLLGSFIARIMARETLATNEYALQLLHLTPTDRVLEIGFAHGRTIQRAADAVPQGSVAGVEVSEQMVRMASRHNRYHIAAGRVVLKLSDGTKLPFGDSTFDKAYCVHVLYFWPEPQNPLREIFRVLQPGGTFLLGFRSHSDKHAGDFPTTIYRFYDPSDVESLLARCGFQAIKTTLAPDQTVFVRAQH